MQKETDAQGFKRNAKNYEVAYRRFIQASSTGLEQTLLSLWEKIIEHPFLFDAAGDMAKFTFRNGRSVHVCTSTRRFHRPKKTGKPKSVTVILGGSAKEYEDAEKQLIPCDTAGRIDCCYFGMGEDEEDLAIFYIEQLIHKSPLRNKVNLKEKSRISSRRSL